MKKSCRTKKLLKILSVTTINVTHSLDLKIKNIGLENAPSEIVKIFRIFDNIKKIKKSQQAVANSSFSFKIISEEEVKNAIKGLPINKSTISGDIPTLAHKKDDMNDQQNSCPVSTLSNLSKVF